MRRSNYKNKKQKSKIKIIVIFFGFLVLLFVLLILFFWKLYSLDKFIYVNKANDGSAEIIIIDPSLEKSHKYLIPSEIELNSARGYGSYKLSSLWALCEKNGNDCKLIPETITKNFSTPIYFWKNGRSTNLSFIQNVKAYFFAKKYLDYDETIHTTKLPNSILINFINPNFLNSIPKIEIEDLSGELNIMEKVSRIIEVIGGKISLNSKGYEENLNCEVYGKDLELAQIFADTFSCDIIYDKTISTDIKIRLGAKFIDRF